MNGAWSNYSIGQKVVYLILAMFVCLVGVSFYIGYFPSPLVQDNWIIPAALLGMILCIPNRLTDYLKLMFTRFDGHHRPGTVVA